MAVQVKYGSDDVTVNNKHLSAEELAAIDVRVKYGHVEVVDRAPDPYKELEGQADRLKAAAVARDEAAVVAVYGEISRSVDGAAGVQAVPPVTEEQPPALDGLPDATRSAAGVVGESRTVRDLNPGLSAGVMTRQAGHLQLCVQIKTIREAGLERVDRHLVPVAVQAGGWVRAVHKAALTLMETNETLAVVGASMRKYVEDPIDRGLKTKALLANAREQIAERVDVEVRRDARERAREDILDRAGARLRSLLDEGDPDKK